VEEYGLDGLAASAEAVLPGLGPLAAGLARLAGEAGRAVTLDAMELLVIERGRELLRGLVQLGLDAQADGEVQLAGVTGADGCRGPGWSAVMPVWWSRRWVRSACGVSRTGPGSRARGRCSRVMRC
jgi:hypothetical protein